jgi:thiosulfate/3-mercaptopyruvate sulfurtransferase
MSRFALVAAMCLFLACSTSTAQQAPGGVLISTADLAAHLKDPNLVLLHVADRPATFEQAHIPGARLLRYDDVAVDGPEELGAELPDVAEIERVFEDAGVSDNSHVVLYGHTVLVARAFFTLDVAGHRHVSVLDGGLGAWQAEHRAVASGPPPFDSAQGKPFDSAQGKPFDSAQGRPTKGTFTPHINRERVATADWVRAHMNGIALVDVRPDPEYTGEDGGMGGMHSPGHLEGARQLPWNALMAADGRFLPADQLRARLTSAGAATAKPVVAYCMIGMRASVVYLVARHLGFDVRLYDGSIVDWTRRQLPTKTGR